MSGDYVDQLARSLATPTTRRRSLGLAAAGAVALATPFRPRFALAQGQGQIVCTPATGDCLEHVCPEGTICCTNKISPGDCPTDPHCCDPCDPSASECLADGHCGPGPGGCKDECCRRFGQGPCCGSSGLCCTPDQICDQSRGICCPPDPDAPPCNVPEDACKKEKDDIVENTMSDCNTGGGDQFSNAASAMADDGIQIMACSFSASTFERSRLYADCPQRPNDAACDGGQGCDRNTLRCNQCIDSRASARRAIKVGHETRSDVDLGRSAKRGKGKVKPAELRRLVQRSDRRFKRAAAAIFDELHAPVQAALPLPALAVAIDDYRREVVRLRRQLDDGDGGRPQKLALTALDEITAMLGAYRAAALAETTAAAQVAVTRGAKRARRARAASRRARQALGCGPERC